MSLGCLEGVWKVCGRYLKGVWRLLGGCLESVLKVFEKCIKSGLIKSGQVRTGQVRTGQVNTVPGYVFCCLNAKIQPIELISSGGPFGPPSVRLRILRPPSGEG